MSLLKNLPLRLSTRPAIVVPRANKSKLALKKLPPDFALEHFDAFYPRVFGKEKWRSIRLAMLTMKKYAAVVNPYCVSEELIQRLNDLGAREIQTFHNTTVTPSAVTRKIEHTAVPNIIEMNEKPAVQEFDESSRLIKEGNTEAMLSYVPATEMIYQEEVVDDDIYFEFLKPEIEVVLKTGDPLPIPKLRVFIFPRGNVRDFPSPRKPIDGLYEYYLMDASSLLPVVALDVKENEDFADFCAAPGGKSLAVAFLQKARSQYCLDISPSRITRLKNIFGNYLPKELRKTISVKQADVTTFDIQETFDKILVDVPCTNDRISVNNPDSNIFHPLDIKKRLELPQKQTKLLTAALNQLRCGGAAVYSTCSLSPVQNDSVVHMAIQGFKDKKFVVTNLNHTFAPFEGVFKFYPDHKYGQLVLPYLPQNFGPMYIARIERVV